MTTTFCCDCHGAQANDSFLTNCWLWVALMFTDEQEFHMSTLGFWPPSLHLPCGCLSVPKPEFAQTWINVSVCGKVSKPLRRWSRCTSWHCWRELQLVLQNTRSHRNTLLLRLHDSLHDPFCTLSKHPYGLHIRDINIYPIPFLLVMFGESGRLV